MTERGEREAERKRGGDIDKKITKIEEAVVRECRREIKIEAERETGR